MAKSAVQYRIGVNGLKHGNSCEFQMLGRYISCTQADHSSFTTCYACRSHAGIPAFVAVGCVLEHRLHLLLGWGCESGCGLVTVRYSCGGRGCPSDGRSGPPLHLLFLLQLIRLQVHVRGGHGALHVWFTAASREKPASLSSYHSQKNMNVFTYWSQENIN